MSSSWDGRIPPFDLPLHTADRGVVQMILNNYLADHMKFEATMGRRNPFSIDREGLELSLITYCAMIRQELTAKEE